MFGPSIINQVSKENIALFLRTREIIDRTIVIQYVEGAPQLSVTQLPENLPAQVVTLIQNGYKAAGWSNAVLNVGARQITLTL